MTQPVLSDKEVKMIGETRWQQKNNKRLLFLLLIGGAFTFGAVQLAKNYPGTPIGFALSLVIGCCMVIGYTQLIGRPAKKAGEAFLKEWRS